MCENCKLKYELPPIFTEILSEKLVKELDFKEIYNNCIQNKFYEDLDYRIKNKMPICLSIVGIDSQDNAKEDAALYIAEYISGKSKGSIKSVFTPLQFIEALKTSKEGDTLIVTSLKTASNANYLKEELSQGETIASMKKLNVINCSPALESHLHEGILEGVGATKNGVHKLVFFTNKEKPLGVVYAGKPSKKLSEKHLKEKKTVIEQIVHRNLDESFTEMENAVQTLLRDKKFLKLKTTSQKKFYVNKKYPELPSKNRDLILELTKEFENR
jgi:hypothetical protein